MGIYLILGELLTCGYQKTPGPVATIPFAVLGDIPDPTIDIPISAVFIALFSLGAIVNERIFRRNKAMGRLFVFSMVVFGFCMSRITTFAMRIVWANHHNNKDLAIVAQVLLSAGVVLLFVTNLVFAQRIMGFIHPSLGSNKFIRIPFIIYYVLIVAVMVMGMLLSTPGKVLK